MNGNGHGHRAAIRSIAKRIKEWEAEDTLKDYGRTHPEALPHHPESRASD